jgi:hypothetical protein
MPVIELRVLPSIRYGCEQYPPKVARRLRALNITTWSAAVFCPDFTCSSRATMRSSTLQDQQLTRHGRGRTRRPVEDPMEGAEIRIAFAPKDTQRRCGGSSTGRQDGAGEQHQNVRPGRAREQICKPREGRYSGCGETASRPSIQLGR